tara:strand:- start:425 stop:1417 length:993 start_codon:yes stop_codon:yes gene_type:complete
LGYDSKKLKMKEDLVTCAFSTYNCYETLENAICSAFNQTYTNIEILVVDDNSTDNTKKLIRKLAKKSEVPFRVIYNDKNIGIGSVRNILVENSKGNFIAFFDDDDFSCSNRILEQISLVKKYEKNSNLLDYSFSPICFSDRLIIDQTKKLICKSIYISESDMFKEKIIRSLLSADSFPKTSSQGSTATCTFFARKESILRVKGFKSELRRFEDLDFVIRALTSKVPIIRSELILVHQNNTKDKEKSNSRDYELLLIDIHKDWLIKRNLYEFSKAYIKLKKNFLKINLKYSLFFICYLFFNYPFRFIKKLSNSTRTIFFTISSYIKFKNIY